jgi:ribosomal protein S18 acetylase RimI-like enzyme
LSEISIKICRKADIPLLEESFPTGKSQFHLQRYQLQQSGGSTYLVAWKDGKPIGRLNLKWVGADEEAVKKVVGTIPEINALGVVGELQSQGIGTRLIGKAEKLAKQRGYQAIGLGVEKINERARELYERLGYRDWGHGLYIASWYETGDDGKKVLRTAEAKYLVKSI